MAVSRDESSRAVDYVPEPNSKGSESNIAKARLFVERHLKRSLLRRLSLVTLGVAIGQIIILLASPLITRLFDPASLGLFGLFSSTAFLFGNISGLRYDMGIVLAKSNQMAAAVLVLCCIVISLFSMIVTFVLISGGNTVLAGFTGSADLPDLLTWLPLQMATIGFSFVMSQWATRKQNFLPLAKSQVAKALFTVAVQVGSGLLVLGAPGLVVGQVLGFGMAAFWLGWMIPATDWRLFWVALSSRRRLKTAANRFRSLPMFSTPQELLASASQPLTMLIIGANFGPATVGFFWLTQRIMQQPGNFVGQALRQVYVQHLASLYNSGKDISASIFKATILLLAGGMMCMAPILVFGPEVFSFLFGASWVEAGAFARWMAIWVVALLANIPAWCGLQAMRLQGRALLWEMGTVGIQTGSLCLLALTADAEYAVAGYAIAGAFMFMARACYSYRQAVFAKKMSTT